MADVTRTYLAALAKAIREHRQRAIYEPADFDLLFDRVRPWDQDLWDKLDQMDDGRAS